jgi:hypothetical protein
LNGQNENLVPFKFRNALNGTIPLVNQNKKVKIDTSLILKELLDQLKKDQNQDVIIETPIRTRGAKSLLSYVFSVLNNSEWYVTFLTDISTKDLTDVMTETHNKLTFLEYGTIDGYLPFSNEEKKLYKLVIDMCCSKIAYDIKGKTPEEIRKMYQMR